MWPEELFELLLRQTIKQVSWEIPLWLNQVLACQSLISKDNSVLVKAWVDFKEQAGAIRTMSINQGFRICENGNIPQNIVLGHQQRMLVNL